MAQQPADNPFADLDARLEEIFEKADDFMINKKSYKDAAKLYEEILALDPENIDALNSLAQCIKLQMLPGQDLFNKVFPLYERALQADPEDFETNFNMGILYYEHVKDLEKAITYLKVAINEERNATAMFNLAVIYEERSEKHKAKELYEEVLKLDPNHFKTKVNLAILLDKEGKGDEAHQFYQEALQQNPRDARIHHNLGINMKRAGRLEDALQYYKKAIELDPENSLVFYNTGILYNILSDYQSGAEALEHSIRMNKHNTYAYLALGDALERQKEIQKAINVYKDLQTLGVQVHGLREKISYLENALVSQKKLAQPPPEPPAGKGKNQKVAATAHHDNAQSMKQPQLQQSGFQENFMKKQSTNISVSPSKPLEGVP